MNRSIYCKDAPNPIGPYSQAVKADNLLFISGQIPINPESGILIDGNIEAQTHQIMKNISNILATASMNLNEIVKTSIFLRDIKQFPIVNKVYAKYFSDDFPARETLEVCNLPANSEIMISAIAVSKKS